MNQIDFNAIVSKLATIGKGTIIERNSEVSAQAKLGEFCKIHRNVFIDNGVIIGNNVKIQDNVMIPSGVILEDGVFIGPSVAFTNDKNPRSITPKGKLKTSEDWLEATTLIKYGASIGANATIICGVTIGEWSMIGAGAVVTKNIPNFALVVGVPASIVGWVDKSGNRLELKSINSGIGCFWSKVENTEYEIPLPIS